MPIKILLADKSITIQKVVEMLFSGKDYEVQCVSDGEAALAEASRSVPDVVLADIDLPRVDGYTFSGRLKQVPGLEQTPIILMMSRDDVFDQGKAKQVAIADHIQKPFESQELIGKVKKAIGASPRTAAPARPPEPAPAQPPPAAQKPAAAKPAPIVSPEPPKPKPKQALPKDIFDIIEDAPGEADSKTSAPVPAEEDAIFEVEPEVEVNEEAPVELTGALPTGPKAVEEMRESLGLAEKGKQSPLEKSGFDIFESEPAAEALEYVPPRKQEPEPVAREWKPPVAEEQAAVPVQHAALSESDLWTMAERIVSKVTTDMIGKMAPAASGEALRVDNQAASKIVREIARDVIEKVAWEVVPDLAAAMIRAEIERLKAEP